MTFCSSAFPISMPNHCLSSHHPRPKRQPWNVPCSLTCLFAQILARQKTSDTGNPARVLRHDPPCSICAPPNAGISYHFTEEEYGQDAFEQARRQTVLDEAPNTGSAGLLRQILSEDNTSTLKVAAIIIMGEADLCGPILESYPFSREARKPRGTDLHQLIYDPTADGTQTWKRQHLGQYIISALSLQKAKSRMLLISPPE